MARLLTIMDSEAAPPGVKELAVSAVGSAANAVGSAAVAPYFDRIMAHLKAYLALNADAAGDPETQVRPRYSQYRL